MPLTRYEQAERFILLAREHKLDAEEYPLRREWRVGSKWYQDPLSVACALISAFDRVGIPIPPELRKRPSDL